MSNAERAERRPIGWTPSLPEELSGQAAEERKPLLMLLSPECFRGFKFGVITAELRRYDDRWNESTCTVGRAVVLSKGYGKQERMTGVISSFRKVKASELGMAERASVAAEHFTLNVDIARIGIGELGPPDMQA